MVSAGCVAAKGILTFRRVRIGGMLPRMGEGAGACMNDYDKARYAIKLAPDGFLRWLLPGLDPSVRFGRWLDAQTIPFPNEPARRPDTVAELVRGDASGPPFVLVVEVQTRPDADLPDRLLEYMARLRASCGTGRTAATVTHWGRWCARRGRRRSSWR